jgi:hypothetical protein
MYQFDELCKAGCFHGLIDSKEAERRLASMKKGFLLRVSANNDTCVTISRKTAEGYKHQRIAKKPNGFNVQIGKEVYSFPSLIDFLMSPQAKERTKKGTCRVVGRVVTLCCVACRRVLHRVC